MTILKVLYPQKTKFFHCQIKTAMRFLVTLHICNYAESRLQLFLCILGILCPAVTNFFLIDRRLASDFCLLESKAIHQPSCKRVHKVCIIAKTTICKLHVIGMQIVILNVLVKLMMTFQYISDTKKTNTHTCTLFENVSLVLFRS